MPGGPQRGSADGAGRRAGIAIRLDRRNRRRGRRCEGVATRGGRVHGSGGLGEATEANRPVEAPDIRRRGRGARPGAAWKRQGGGEEFLERQRGTEKRGGAGDRGERGICILGNVKIV